jgi:MFS transporter, AAHS family, 3-hydroxyphenylpropionic acid transporter
MLTRTRQIELAAGLTLAFCFAAALCEGFDVQAAGVAAVGIRGEWHPSPGGLGFFFSAGNFGLFLGAIVGGLLTDRLGSRAVLIGSLATFGVFSLLTSQAPNLPTLIGMRALTGFGLGGAMPNLIVLAAASSATQSRNARIAISYIGMPIGGAIASLIVALIPFQHWRWIFIIGGTAPLIVAAAMIVFMPKQPAGSVAPARDANTPALRVLLGHGRAWHTLLLWVGFFLMQVTFQIMLNWLPLLMQARALPKNELAFAQTGFNLGGATAALLMGFLLDRPLRLASIAFAVAALPVVLLLLANAPNGSAVLVALPLLVGAAILSFQVILYGVTTRVYPASVQGAGMGAAVGIGRLGAIVGPAFAAVLLGAGRTPAQVVTAVLPLSIVCGLCVAALGWRAFRAQPAAQLD